MLWEAHKALAMPPPPAQSGGHAISTRGGQTSRDAGASAVTPPKAASQQAGTG